MSHRYLGSVLLICLCLVLGGSPAGAVPAIPADYSGYPHLDRIDDLPGMTYAVEAYSLWGGDYFAVANELSGVNIYQIVGGEALPMGAEHALGSERDIAVRDWYAFVATGLQGLSAMSLAVPVSPLELNSVTLPGEAVRVDITATHAYVACSEGGLAIVDISNPGALLASGSYGTEVTAVCVDGSRLGIIHDSMFEILDISTPDTPVFLGAYDNGATSNYIDVVLQGNLAYVVNKDQVERLDITDPEAISQMDTYPLNYPYYLYESRLEIEGPELFVAAKGYLGILDFATGAVSRESKQVGLILDAACLAGTIMATGEDRVEIIRDGLHASPVPAGEINGAGLIVPMGIIFEDVAYGKSLTPANGLAAMELGGTDGLLWSLDLGLGFNGIHTMVHHGTTVAVLTGSGYLTLATISRYDAVQRGTLFMTDYSRTLSDRTMAFLDGETLIVLDRGNGTPESYLRVIDISDLDDPQQIGQYPLPKRGSGDALIEGSRVLVAYNFELLIFDAQDAQNLQSLGTHVFDDTGTRIYSRDQWVYVVHRGSQTTLQGSENLEVWNFADPSAPSFSHQMNIARASNLVFAENWAYQAGTGLILDISDPSQPVPAGNFSLANTSVSQMTHVLASREYILTGYMASGHGHFLAAHLGTGEISAVEDAIPEAGAGLALEAFPNPFNPRVTLKFEVAAGASAQLDIFDLRGRLVAPLGARYRGPGPHRVTWDGRDVRGRELPSGVYLARMTTGEESAAVKVVLAK